MTDSIPAGPSPGQLRPPHPSTTLSSQPANGIGPAVVRKGSFALTRAPQPQPQPQPHDLNGNGSPDVLARAEVDTVEQRGWLGELH